MGLMGVVGKEKERIRSGDGRVEGKAADIHPRHHPRRRPFPSPSPPGERDRLVALLAFAITDEAEMGVREFFLTPAESAKGTKNQSHQSL